MPRRPSAELIELLAPFDEGLTGFALSARKALLGRVPTAWELIYQTYAVSTAFSFTEDLKNAFCHVAVYRKHVNLGFNRGAELPDPDGVLEGTGRLIRHVRLGPDVDLTRGPVATLIDQAIDNMRESMGERGQAPIKGRAVVKSKPKTAR